MSGNYLNEAGEITPEEWEKLKTALDKYSQPMQPGPLMDKNRRQVSAIMKARQVNKSSKGKHPTNYTPPKKKRK